MSVRFRALAAGATLAASAAVLVPATAPAASSKGCNDKGFTVTQPAGGRIQVRGLYVSFDVDPATFAVYDYAFTGAPNPLDMTGGRRLVAFASKVPDLRGLTLTGPITVDPDKETVELDRSGPGVSMKIQANDCASGGIFQMEPSRADGTATRITHTLGPDAFYFDNPNFRAREGDVLPFKDTTVTVASRIDIGSDTSSRFVGRDSPQAATRVTQGCVNTIPAPKRPGGTASVDHCGGVSVWDVQSGGRMGGVFGEDAVEVAPPATTCTHQCKAQDQVRGAAVVLGFPFPVPTANRLFPRLPA
jgi:hypothetical protein